MIRLATIGLSVVAVVGAAGSVVLSDRRDWNIFISTLLVYVAVGVVLTWRRPRHPVGWLLLTSGVSLEVTSAGNAYAWRPYVGEPGSLPIGAAVVFLQLGWIPGIFSLLLAILLFPTGRLPSPRWRIPAAIIVIDGIALLLGALLGTSEFQVRSSDPATSALAVAVPNPLFVDVPLSATLRRFFEAPTVQGPILLVPIAAVVARLRGSRGIERQQMKLFTYAAALALGLAAASTLRLIDGDQVGVVSVIALDLIPVAVAVAIFRYRLYEIDILIRRTVVYGATTAALGATFFGTILVLQSPLGSLTGGSDIAVALSTIVCYALFQPVRRRVQEIVDAKFFRSRRDAAGVLEGLALRLVARVELDAVHTEVVAAARVTMRPDRVDLWLRRARI